MYQVLCLLDHTQGIGTPLDPSLNPPVLIEHNQKDEVCHSHSHFHPYWETGSEKYHHIETALPQVVENPKDVVTHSPTILDLPQDEHHCYPSLHQYDFLPWADHQNQAFCIQVQPLFLYTHLQDASVEKKKKKKR